MYPSTALVAVLLAGSVSAYPSLTPRANSVDPHLGVNNASSGATESVTPGAGPNGAESWFNTGIDNNSGWKPPFLAWSSVKHIDATAFYKGAGKACKQFDQYFQSSGKKYNLDPAILACIAMQESSCNPNAGGGTPGLMQVACENYPNGRCSSSVSDNVDAGAHYLRQQLDDNNQNALLAIGSYNGWFTEQTGNGMNGQKGLTQDYPCGKGQQNGDPQNLDYLQQTLNGWFLGLDPYGQESWIGTEKCKGQCGGGAKC